MGGYGDLGAAARAADIIATRWTPLVVWNVLIGCRTFTEIRRGIPRISPTVLTERLRMLERVGVLRRGISRDGHVVYLPTDMGLGLREVVRVMSAWGERWVEPAPEHYEASMVLWELSHLLEPEDLPEGRVIVRFDIDEERRHHWLLLDRPERELRDRPLNAPDDLVVVASAQWLTEWFMGRLSLEAGRRAGLVAVTGPAALHAMLDGWEGLGSWLRPDPEAALLPAAAGSSTAG